MIEVLIPEDAEAAVLNSQATISNIPLGYGGPSVLSDESLTPGIQGDSTFVEILAVLADTGSPAANTVIGGLAIIAATASVSLASRRKNLYDI